MAKKRRIPNASSFGERSEPHIIEMDRPGRDWIPIRGAPAQFQAIQRPFRKRTASSDTIREFAEEALQEPRFIAFSDDGLVLLLGSEHVSGEQGPGLDQIAPYAPHEAIDGSDGRVRPVSGEFATRITKLWEQMEIRFRTAHRVGDCRVLARCGSPIAERFTSLAPDVFDAFKIIDWQNGVAVSLAGDRLYSIHAAPPSAHDEKTLAIIRDFEHSPLKLQVGQYLYLHHPNGLVGDKVTGSIIKKIRVHCFGKDINGKLDEKTIRDAYKLFRKLLSSKPSAELLERIEFRSVKPRKKKAAGAN
ncbi:MAG TPA: hypothetical protein VFC45_13655 [Pseudolabrys sp.]|nr:hypothetical protein [Pseudolabrys sp.]